MENMDKGLTVPKWALIVRPKIPQMTKNLSAQMFWISMENGFDRPYFVDELITNETF